jgi:transmembrane 9 superfamily protein 2/4
MIAHLISVAWAFNFARAFYLPGVAPREFASGEKVELKVILEFLCVRYDVNSQVNKLTSVRTQLPYDYYSHKFCKPHGGVQATAENLGEFLSGDRIENSP